MNTDGVPYKTGIEHHLKKRISDRYEQFLHEAHEDWQRVVVVSYHTQGAYEGENARLVASMADFAGLEKDIVCRSDLPDGDWKRAVAEKPAMLRWWVEKWPGRPILFVDADAVFRCDPRERVPNTWELFVGGRPSMSVHSFRIGHPCSGTIVLSSRHNPIQVRRVLQDWEDIQAKTIDKLRQPQYALREVSCNKGLAPEWCWIFDLSHRRYPMPEGGPVVEHLQASRDYRDDIESNPHLKKSRKEKLESFSPSTIEADVFIENITCPERKRGV